MHNLNIILVLAVCFTTCPFSQNVNQNYKILFKSECSMPDAMDILYNTYSSIVGDKNVYDLTIEKYNFNFGKIKLLLDNEPNSAQIYELYKNKNIVSFEFINNEVRNEKFNEFIKKYEKKPQKLLKILPIPNYELILKYKFKSNSEHENWFLVKLFGRRGSYEKDANELVISIPENTSESFIKNLELNNKIVYVQKQ